MASNRLLAILTASILFSAGSAANAAFTLAELQRIEGLIVSQDCGALMSYLQANPSLVEGDDPLAVELRNFSAGIRGGIVQCLSDDGVGTGNTNSSDLASTY